MKPVHADVENVNAARIKKTAGDIIILWAVDSQRRAEHEQATGAMVSSSSLNRRHDLTSS